MRVLLTTVGSRGDVQPLLALAVRLKAAGHQPRMCVPPDFQDWIGGLGIEVTPIGAAMRKVLGSSPRTSYTPEQLRGMAEAQVAAQFDKIAAAADGCDVIVAASPLLLTARSVAQMRGIGYVFAVYSPNMLPSPHHAPPPMPLPGQLPAPPGADHRELWARDAEKTNTMFRAALNAQRASVGLAALDDVRGHVFTDRPWLHADPTLGPWPEPADQQVFHRHVFQSGAWILPDERPLSPELEAFLDSGEPPVYFGFGSIRVQHDLGQVMVETARALGRRAVVARGWAELTLPDDGSDCIAVGEVNEQALFRRVAAVVHHGGSGTTTSTALAGAPHVVVPQIYDQHYWAGRVEQLGIGVAHAPGVPTADSLTSALKCALQPDVAERARSVAAVVRRDGTQLAVERMTTTDLRA
ncbi:glycosyltransferase [Plantactinospora endophytica]|uniref:Glycosyl transferase n=1 Tax=Plantactinospora endophytica TaxID=673535 RepID=A0ABQ4E6N7_9ACTN|nr:glycosyltransferase [Plantactinospora endophytica]GIG90353.1 glycosyl transferase [Plantactinospora endophytica]